MHVFLFFGGGNLLALFLLGGFDILVYTAVRNFALKRCVHVGQGSVQSLLK
jgi:hypothetical protein